MADHRSKFQIILLIYAPDGIMENVVIDYLQLIDFDKSKCLSRNKELELIKDELKNLADELNTKIVATSICR